ncbi:MAG TPA: transcription elongation factor GreA [Gaiellaceae bacterium]
MSSTAALNSNQVSATVITRDGLARLEAELEQLKSAGRDEIAERLRAAMSTDANAAENADLNQARDEQALLERRIAILEDRLRSAEPVDPDAFNGVVDVGERVRLHDLETGRRHSYDLVGSLESDVFAGRVSSSSPLGRALIGLRKGQVAVVQAPRGPRRLKILAIETR